MARLRWRDLTLWERLWIFVVVLVVLVLVGVALEAVVERDGGGGRETPAGAPRA